MPCMAVIFIAKQRKNVPMNSAESFAFKLYSVIVCRIVDECLKFATLEKLKRDIGTSYQLATNEQLWHGRETRPVPECISGSGSLQNIDRCERHSELGDNRSRPVAYSTLWGLGRSLHEKNNTIFFDNFLQLVRCPIKL